MNINTTSTRTLEFQWKQISRMIFNDDTPAIQRTEMKRAYYAGAKTMFSLLTTINVEDEEEAAIKVQELDAECMEFAEKIARGEA